MCFGGKKSSQPAPAPVVAQPNPNSVADNSNAVQQKAQVVAATQAQQQNPGMSSFGSELGAGGTTTGAAA